MPDVVIDVFDKYWDPRTHVGQRFRTACEDAAAARGVTSWDDVTFTRLHDDRGDFLRVTVINANQAPSPAITHADIADLLSQWGSQR